MAGGISIHGVDVAHGRTARGMRVQVFRIHRDGGRQLLADGALAEDGLLHHPVAQGDGIAEGLHEVVFHIGDFFAISKNPPPRFLDQVPFRFQVYDAALHYHLPMKFTPWGFSLYRGA